MGHRTLPDGTIWFPVKGKPPACPTGYIRTSDPFIFEPALNDCEHRIEKDFKQPCGNCVPKLYCMREDLYVNKGICKNCQEKA